MLWDGMDLREVPGIGKAISDKIAELVDTGGLRYYERLNQRPSSRRGCSIFCGSPISDRRPR